MRFMREPEDTPAELGELIRFGAVASVDLAVGRCTIDTGDVVSGPIRWIELRAGRTRTWSPPSVGEQVLLICPEGELAAGVALRGISSDAFPPAGDAVRELVEFEDGAVIAYDPVTHALEAVLPGGATARIVAPGGVTIDADVRILGDVAIEGKVDATGDVVGQGKSLATHRHLAVQPGNGVSGTPQ